MSGTAALAQRYKKRYTNSIWTIPLEGASPMRDGFIKIAAATPDLHVADCALNYIDEYAYGECGFSQITLPESLANIHR